MKFGYIIHEKEIIIKDENVLIGLMRHNFHETLIDITIYIAKKYGIIITESYREERQPGDVHSTDPVRAIDLRSWAYDKNLAFLIEDEINKNWFYDPSRPNMKVAQIHKVKNGGFHFHIQVSDDTTIFKK